MRRNLTLTAMLLLVAAPLTASQFIPMPFHELVGTSSIIVHGNVGRVWSTWDARQELVYTYAEVLVSGYLEGDGASSVIVKEVGGKVDDYTLEAIGFPVLRSGEEVVLFLAPWEDAYRIQGYAQGKYLVSRVGGEMTVSLDPIAQGDERLHSDRPVVETLRMNELVQMVRAAVAGKAQQPVSQN